MPNYDNTNRGVLFIKKDRLNDRQPNMTGQINVNGIEYRLSAWTNHKKSDGEKYLSLSIKPKDEAEQQSKDPLEDMDSLPF